MLVDTPPHAAPPEAASLLDQLNPQQRLAVEHGVNHGAGAMRGTAAAGGPLLVIAGAGSGKTHTLAHRVAHLIAHGADPGQLMLLTFSRRAAAQMVRRVEQILARAAAADRRFPAGALTWAGTFHGIGARLLRDYALLIGLAPSFTIGDREDSADLMNLVRHDIGLSAQGRRFPTKSTCLAIYSKVVNTGAALETVLAQAFPWCAEWEAELRQLFGAYVAAKQAQHVLDYDDLLLYWAQMAAEPAIAADLDTRFPHVLVDEYQDTNRLQASILMALKPGGHGLTVVGDDAQSIYSFRGATVRNILEFPTQYEPPARVVTLERNYRSTQPILAASNAVIGLASARYAKELWSDRAATTRPQLVTVADDLGQARYVAEQILAGREAGLTLRAHGVLFRASHHSAALEIELTRRNLPFVKFGGLKFLDTRHVKDMLAVLRWIENPRDRIAGFRALQILPGVGPATAAHLLDALNASIAPPPHALTMLPAPPREIDGWQPFANLVVALAAGALPWPAEFERLREWYQPHLERMHEDAALRLADLEQLERIAASFASRERFLTELTLDPPDASSDESGVPLRDEDYLTLSTIHSAKGQEWSSVFILNGVDGCIPSDLGTGSEEEIEEERRLLYVAMTRAKDHLHIVVPQRFYVTRQAAGGDRHIYASRTRFIPPRIAGVFEARGWPSSTPSAVGASALAAVKTDIAAKMRKMWESP